MKKLITAIATGLTAITALAAPEAVFSTDTFDHFTLHTYASFDAMADVSFIVEGENSLVVIEPQAFKGKVEEFTAYTDKLGKPIDRVLVSFHAAGLKVYPNEQKVITKPMAEFMKSDKAKGMLGFFDKAFGGAMDTDVVEFDEQIDASTTFVVDGVTYTLEPTSVPGMPGVNIAIGDSVYYQHFAPAKGFHASKNQINSRAAIDGALIDALKAKAAGYTLLLGSHGYGKAGAEDLSFQIQYLETMRRIAAHSGNADDFIAQMNAAYSNCKGEEDLKGIAAKLYPPASVNQAAVNKAAALDFFQLILVDRDYETARKYTGEYIQHDPRIGDGYDALVEALETNPLWKDRPQSQIEFKNVAADGDLVYLQTHKEIKAHDDGSPARLVVTHLFRFDDNGKIAEHWTYSQMAKLNDSVSKHPLF
ncbi:nuclear transport factor 2 family protein [Pontiellaceae bacterium B1224]|nr:nuclear transport factor 2 family protein [Pontiellaceae bacterium B1224]